MKTVLFTIKCLTNLHVGNGDVNFNIIDQEVEKDPITGYPTINASGVKGALRDFFEQRNDFSEQVIDIFGKANESKTNENGSGSAFENEGKIKILAANMLSRAMRASSGDKAYYLVTTPTALQQFENLSAGAFGIDISFPEVAAPENAKAEGITSTKSVKCFEDDVLVVSDEAFRAVPLPVIARNCVDPKNRNLWYEENVPHESVFYFFVRSAEQTLLKKFVDALDGAVVQFGANASIGYGLCKVTKRGESNE